MVTHWMYVHFGFRPLSGFLLSNHNDTCYIFKSLCVSVPYRGSYFLIDLINFEEIAKKRFRPLSGFLLSNHSIRPGNPLYTVSVPYRGSYFLIGDKELQAYIQRCFRPLSGFLLSNQLFEAPIKMTLSGFRPLSGFLLSNLDEKKLKEVLEKFPSPIGVPTF